MSPSNRGRSSYSSVLITAAVITQFAQFLDIGVFGAPSLKLFGKSVSPVPTSLNLTLDGDNETLSSESHEYSRHLRKVLQEEKVCIIILLYYASPRSSIFNMLQIY